MKNNGDASPLEKMPINILRHTGVNQMNIAQNLTEQTNVALQNVPNEAKAMMRIKVNNKQFSSVIEDLDENLSSPAPYGGAKQPQPGKKMEKRISQNNNNTLLGH